MSEVRTAQKHKDLVFDVGMHKGEDTDYYLRKGFNVIGFEANPDLVAHCRSRFANEIENETLIVVEGAIVVQPTGNTRVNTVKFYKNKDWSVWGTADSDWARRNNLLGATSEIIEVPVVRFAECLVTYGIPHYLKIDIEGMDMVCLSEMIHFEQKPDYVSIESEKVSFEKLVEELNLLNQLGYTSFKAVQQSGISHQKEPNPSKEKSCASYHFLEGSSGLFGEDLPHEWKAYKQILNEYRLIFTQYTLFGDHGKLNKYFAGEIFRKTVSKSLRRRWPGWYDTHAKHSSVVG
jgi:FkbM family methyltransferase